LSIILQTNDDIAAHFGEISDFACSLDPAILINTDQFSNANDLHGKRRSTSL
jgi:hypothetical protein